MLLVITIVEEKFIFPVIIYHKITLPITLLESIKCNFFAIINIGFIIYIIYFFFC